MERAGTVLLQKKMGTKINYQAKNNFWAGEIFSKKKNG